jgi:hypothetical protein
LRRSEAGGLGGLKAAVGQIDAPTVPGRSGSRVGERRIGGALVRHLFRIAFLQAAEGPAAHEGRHHAALVIRQTRALAFHYAGGERIIDFLRGHLANRGRRGSAFHVRISVAPHAALLEYREARFRTGRLRRRPRRRLSETSADEYARHPHCVE